MESLSYVSCVCVCKMAAVGSKLALQKLIPAQYLPLTLFDPVQIRLCRVRCLLTHLQMMFPLSPKDIHKAYTSFYSLPNITLRYLAFIWRALYRK